jgi:hypothetical protein
MDRNKILGSHVRRLLSGVSDHGQRHLREVESDLVQTVSLLEEAIGKLSVNFMAIHGAVSSRQETIDLVVAGGTPTPENTASLAAMQGEVGGYVNAAITSLQFQDMTSQLLERTLKRVGGLRQFLDTLGTHGDQIHAESQSEELADLLGQVSMALAIQSLELRTVLRKAVTQQHLESGDIELF